MTNSHWDYETALRRFIENDTPTGRTLADDGWEDVCGAFLAKIEELETRIQAGLCATQALTDDYDKSTKFEIRGQIAQALRGELS